MLVAIFICSGCHNFGFLPNLVRAKNYWILYKISSQILSVERGGELNAYIIIIIKIYR